VPAAFLDLLRDFAERAIVALVVLAILLGALFFWVSSVVTCITFLVAASVRVTAAVWSAHRAAIPAPQTGFDAKPRNA